MRAKSNTKNGKNIKTSNNNNSGKFSVKKSLKENVSTSNTKPDNSVLRPPIDTSIAGLKQAVKLFDTGTPEVVHYMTYECDVIYECRVCRNLFRSLANFISHKRVYCTRRFSHVQSSPLVEDHTILVEEDLSENNSSNALPSRITARQDLTSILQTSAAKYYKDVEEKLVSRDINRCDATVHLQPIENTTYGVYQTVGKTDGDKLIKNQVSELHRIISKNEEAVLGPDGKVILEGGDTSGSSDQIMPEQMVVNGLICSICKLKFSSKKTLSHHTKTVHDSFRVCYSCPCCKNLFSNTWSVHRHLFKVHRKSNDQVRRLRAQIQKKQVRAEKLTEKFKKGELNKSSKEESIKDNKSWMKQLEDDSELQRCGGCGRRFERRAALISHAQTCHKRIAASNSTHSPKRKEEKINESFSEISAISSKQQSTQGTPVQKVQSEKRIGIQVRMNYCKNTVGTVTEKRRSERHKSSEDKDDDISECASLDGLSKDRIIYQSTESVNKIKSEVIRDVEERVSLCNSSVNNVSGSENSKKLVPQPNGNKISKRLKMKRLEKMCMQLKEAAGFETTNHSKSKKGSAANINALLNTVDLIDAEKDKISGNGSKNKIGGKESIPVNNKESNAVINGIENEIIKTCASRTSNASRKSSISNECDEHSIDSGFSTRLKEKKIVPEQFISECKDDSVSTLMLSGKEQTVDEPVFISESSEKSEPVSDKQTENEMSSQSNFEDDKSVANDSIGILTRYKVRSIFKSDNSGTDYSMVESSDQEDLSNADESNVLKENMSEGNEDDHTNWIQKKMNRYIHFKSKQCLICLKKFKALLEIQTHVANHLGWNKFHCLFSNCTYTTFLKSECTKHVMKTHLKPHEKNRAPSLVGEIGGQVKNNSCDIDFKCNFKKLNKRKKSDSEELSLDQTVLKESVGSEVEVYENNSVTCISINDDSNEIVAQEFVQTSKIDSSCSEQSDIEPRFKQKLKRRKVSKVEKRMTPPIRKCSPDSTTELMEANSRASSVGAQFRNELLDATEVKENDNNESTMVIKMEEVIECSSVLETSNSSNSDLKKDDSETQVTVLDDITEHNAEKSSNQENEQEQLINTESIDSDIQGKGRETEEEDSVQDGGSIETNMDQSNLIRMVMEVIFGGQGQVATKSETK